MNQPSKTPDRSQKQRDLKPSGKKQTPPQVQNVKNDRNATPQKSDVAEDLDFFPPRLYELLPKTLQKVTRVLETSRERAVFLAGALPVLAGTASNVLLRYGQQWQALNLFFLIVAPAGAGKAAFRHARRMGDKMQDWLIRESKKALAKWKAQRESEGSNAGPRPPLRSFFLAGDNSAAGLKEELAANPHGVIFDTEIKTVATVFVQEWGQYRDVLLKSAHNEPLTKKRKGEEPIHIERPALSVGLSGTPRSVVEIITDPEDGLFSRCLFLAFDGGTDFRDMFEDDTDEALDAALSEAAERLDDLRKVLEERDEPLYVKIGPQERRRIVEAGRYATAQVMRSKVGRHFLSNVRRAALSAFRIAALLCLLRLFEQGTSFTPVRSVKVSDSDVEAGLIVALTCLEHAAFLSGKLQNKDRLKGLKGEKRAYFKALPAGTFTTAEAKVVAADFSFSERSAERYLQAYVERGLLSDVKHGTWRKPKFAPVSFLSLSRSEFDQNDENDKTATPRNSEARHPATTFGNNGRPGDNPEDTWEDI